MAYRVHRVDLREGSTQEQLQRALDRIDGEIVRIVSVVEPVFRPFGASARTTHLLIVERPRG